MDAAKLVLFGIAIGAVLANALAIRRAPKAAVRWSGTIFFLAVAAYAGAIAQVEPNQSNLPYPPWHIIVLNLPVRILSVGTVGWFWLFVQALFGDSKVRPIHLAVIGALTAIGLVAVYTPYEISRWVWLASNLFNAGLLIHAMLIVWRGWKSDLVETRRRLRGPFLMMVSIYTLVMRGFETWASFNGNPSWYLAFNAATLAFMCLAATWAFLDARVELFGPLQPAARPAQTPSTPSRAAKADLDRLDALMKTEQVWREEGLTISSLAVRANIPEAHLRRLINDQLGHRNFPSFVNAHRIAEAKARLADPDEARTPISAIAFDLGFGSLGPFNRAFREETGVSPSEWRRAALDSPADGKADGEKETA